jgi:hypothetical protein
MNGKAYYSAAGRHTSLYIIKTYKGELLHAVQGIHTAKNKPMYIGLA